MPIHHRRRPADDRGGERSELMGREMYETFRCSCGERCQMIPHEKSGKLAPITAAKYDIGNIELLQGATGEPDTIYRVVPKAEREADPKPRYLNHWSSCVDADRFRR